MPTDNPSSASPEPEKPRLPRRPPAVSGDSQIPSFIGAFKVSRLIAKDALGVIYEAAQEIPSRTVSVRVVRPDYFSAAAQKRFSYLAESLVRIQHPGLACVYAASIIETKAGKQPYFAAEIVSGEALEAYALAHSLDNRQRLALIADLADSVQAIHVAGLVHRALSPSSILVDHEGRLKILGVGVAHCSDCDTQALALNTTLESIFSALSYMAPEQTAAKNAPIDTRTDVYSLGLIAYHLLSGRLPYDVKQPTIAEAIAVIRDKPAASLSEASSELRGDAEAIVGKALEKDKSLRYQSALDFAADIRRFLNHEPVSARPQTAGYRAARFARRHVVLASAAALVLVALLAAVTGVALAAKKSRAAEQAARNDVSDLSQQLQIAQNQAHSAVEAVAQAKLDADLARKAEQDAQNQIAVARQAEQSAREQLQSAQHAMAPAAPATQTAQGPAPPASGEVIPPSDAAPAQLVDAVLSNAEALTEAGRRDEAMNSLTAARPLAAGNAAATRRLDLVLSNLLLRFPPPLYHNPAIKGATRQIALLPDGHTLAVSDLHDIVLVDALTGAALRRANEFAPNIRDLAVSSDGTLLAATAPGTKKQMVVLSLPDLKSVGEFSDRAVVAGVVFAPQRPVIAYFQAGRITVFDAHDLTKRVVRDIDDLEPRVAFSRDGGSLYAATAGHRILVLNAVTLQTTTAINCPGEPGQITPLPAPDGSLFVASEAGLIRHVLPGYAALLQYAGSYSAGTLALSSSAKSLAAGGGGLVRVYDVGTGQELHALADNRPAASVADATTFSPDGGILYDLDFYSGLRAWPVSTPRFPNPLGSHNGAVRAVAVSSDGRLGISSADDHTAMLWDLPSGMPLAALGGASGSCESVAFGKDPFSFRSVGADGKLYTWDLHGHVAVQSRKLPDAALSALAISADEKTFAAAGPAGSPLIIGNLSADQPPQSVTAQPAWSEFDELQFSADGQSLLANTTAGPELFDTHSLKRAKLDKSIAGGRLFAFSRDGTCVFAGMDNGQVVRWSLAESAGAAAPTNAAAITSICEGGDAGATPILAVGAADRCITLADPVSLQPLTRLNGFPGPVTHLAFSPDGHWLMASSGNDVFLIDLRSSADQTALAADAQDARENLDTDPKDSQALLKLGLYYASPHADAWAVELLARAKTAGADVPALPLARAYWRLRQPALATQEFRRAMDRKEAPDDYLKLCMESVISPPPVAPIRHLGG